MASPGSDRALKGAGQDRIPVGVDLANREVGRADIREVRVMSRESGLFGVGPLVRSRQGRAKRKLPGSSWSVSGETGSASKGSGEVDSLTAGLGEAEFTTEGLGEMETVRAELEKHSARHIKIAGTRICSDLP